MNGSIYKVVYSDIKGKPVSHPPITYKVKFRSFERAMKTARRLHLVNRDVVVIESDSQGMIASWELNTDYKGGMIFEYNKTRTDLN